MPQPLVSVIIPAYNGEKYIAEAIDSVLSQGYDNYELLVIDNNSTDNTKAIVKSYPQAKYIYSEIADTARARNQGLALARGDYIAFLDQDDVWTEGKLKRQIEFLESNPIYGAVIGLQKMFLQEGYQKPHWLKQEFLVKPQPGYLPSALTVRRSTLARTDKFDVNFSNTSDIAWFLKAIHSGVLIKSLDEVVVNRRIHDDNASNKYLALQREILTVLKASLSERRKQAV